MSLLRCGFQLDRGIPTQSPWLPPHHDCYAHLRLLVVDTDAILGLADEDGHPQVRQVPQPSPGQLILWLLFPRGQALHVRDWLVWHHSDAQNNALRRHDPHWLPGNIRFHSGRGRPPSQKL